MRTKRVKVPVILQMEALECGAASLGMILAYYKKYIPLEQLRGDCGVSRDGSKASNIVQAARYHGMEAKGYRYSVEKLTMLEVFPVIIHWNFNHFVVLDGFEKGKAVINDPASGVIRVDMDEFEKSYTGITLVMTPGEDFKPEGKKKTIFGFLSVYLSRYKTALFWLLLCGLLIALFGIVVPVFSRVFMDYVLLQGAEDWMDYLIKAMLVVLVILCLLKCIMAEILYRSKKTMAMEMNTRFIWHTLRLPVEFYQQRSPGDISGRQADNEQVTESLFESLAPVFIDIMMALLYAAVLFYLNPMMAVVALVAVAIQIGAMKWVSASNFSDSKNITRDEGKYTGTAMAGVTMIETIKSSGAEEGYFGKISGYLAKYNNSVTRSKTKLLFLDFFPGFMSSLCNAIILILGIYYILSGQFTIGILLAFQGFLSSMLSPVGSVLGVGSEIQATTARMERIQDVLDYPVDVPETSSVTLDIPCSKLSGRVYFEQVCFSYGKLMPDFISDFNLQIEPGQVVAITGGSGSGKSTLAGLLTGIYPVRQGQILFDGKQRQDIDPDLFHESIGIVNQKISIFKDSIRNNLTLWNTMIPEQTMIEACKIAGIYEEIMMRPEGFDFQLTEGGRNFSGGQRQRLEIARALMKNPSLLILDEATSALDAATERHVMDALKERKITCIMIAHRLSTIRNADWIVVMDHGRIAEEGTHETLLQMQGAYFRLVHSEH